MINKLLNIFRGKDLILYNPHRNSNPLVNKTNREHYIFFNPELLWKSTALVGRKSRLRYKIMYGILTLLNPIYIIDINWLEKRQSVYLVWCNNYDRSFIVVQHGIFHGGIVQFVPEKYVKCNVFLVWGPHFKKMFEACNRGKDFHCISFGNTCYNMYERSEFSYKEEIGNSILIAVSVMEGQRLEKLYRLMDKLQQLGFEVTVKEHALQLRKASVSIEGYRKISGNLYNILKEQQFDIVITDVSSAMTDIIFFKNRAIYFSPEQEGSNLNVNVYSEYLNNLALEFDSINTRQDLLNFVDLKLQEDLLKYLIKTENTSNDLAQIEKYIREQEENKHEERHDAEIVKA